MSAIDWGSVADWVSGLGSVAASGIALYLAGAQGRAQRNAERPTVSVKVEGRQGHDWVRLTIRFDNPGSKEWDITTVSVKAPRNGRVVHERHCYLPPSTDEPWKPSQFSEDARAEAAKRTIDAGGVLEPFSERLGSESAIYRNTRYISVVAKVGEARAKLKLDISFTSREAVPDAFTLRVIRSIDAAVAD